MTPSQQTLDQLAQRAGQLYSLPAVAMQVLELSNNPRVDTHALRECIEKDPALTAKILRTVNSSLFGLSRRVSDLNQALSLLGVKPLKLLVLGFNLPAGLFVGLRAETLGRYWRQTLTKAVAAREISESLYRTPGDDAFIAGLLQDLGQIVLVQELGEPYLRFLDRVYEDRRDLLAAEREALGFDHTTLTARLLDRWNLPPALVEAADAGANAVTPLARIVRMADMLARLLVDGRLDVLRELLEQQGEARRLSHGQLEALVAALDDKVESLADILNLQLRDGLEYRDVLAAAHAQLSEVAADAAATLLRGDAAQGPTGGEAALLDELQELAEAVARVAAGGPRAPLAPAATSGTTNSSLASRAAANSASAMVATAAEATTRGEIAAEETAELLQRVQHAVGVCRQSRCPLSLLLIDASPADRTARDWLTNVCQSIDQPGSVRVPHGDGWAIVLPDCERRLAIAYGHQLLAEMQGQGGREVAAPSVGVATVSLPPKNFPAAALLEGAARCLNGSRASGGGVVKSIEIY